MNATESELVEAAAGGDREAAETLVERHYERLFAFLRRHVNHEADAADLTQRTFARIWQALPRFAHRSSVSSWMHAIAWHTYVDWLRQDHRAENRPDAWWTGCAAGGASPAEDVESADLAAVVYTAVDQLEPDLRVTVHLHYYQGLSLAETADALEIAASTVKHRLRRALEHLQGRLQEDRHSLANPAPQRVP
jgi:RNA polymerase sigma-70 factor, ECF subfamily